MEKEKEKPRKKKGGPVETMASKADPHQMYQMAIQSPKEEIRLFVKVFTTARHRKPLIMREDFCGTAYLCAEWVKGDAERFAYGLDIDASVIKWGLEHNKVDAGPAGDRMELFVRDVNDVTNTLGKKCDVLVAVNYSICYFHSRTKLITYFTNIQKGMKPDGIFVCDLLGGTSSLGELKKEVRVTESLTKIWEQLSFDAYSHRLKGQVSFKFSDGSRMKAAFTYDFRLWMLPEVIECLYEAGFKDVKVWWADNDDREDVKSAYEEVTSIEQTDSWKVYIIGLL